MQSANLLLASLSASDAAAIVPHLRPVQLEHQSILFDAGDPIKAVYFPTGAIISLVGLSTGETVEAAMVGKDGVVGAASALDGKISLNRAIVQISGTSLVCDVDALRGAALQSQSLLSKIVRHEQTVFAQAQQSTACMATHDVEARLCRWLLRARDLSGGDTLLFTQEFLAEMLGVRRTSVYTRGARFKFSAWTACERRPASATKPSNRNTGPCWETTRHQAPSFARANFRIRCGAM